MTDRVVVEEDAGDDARCFSYRQLHIRRRQRQNTVLLSAPRTSLSTRPASYADILVERRRRWNHTPCQFRGARSDHPRPRNDPPRCEPFSKAHRPAVLVPTSAHWHLPAGTGAAARLAVRLEPGKRRVQFAEPSRRRDSPPLPTARRAPASSKASGAHGRWTSVGPLRLASERNSRAAIHTPPGRHGT